MSIAAVNQTTTPTLPDTTPTTATPPATPHALYPATAHHSAAAAPAAQEYPFFPPQPRFPSWRVDKACLESNYVLMHKHKDSTDPWNDKAIPTVFFAASVWSELQYLVRRQTPVTGECGFFLLVKQLSPDVPHFLIYDFFLVGQECSGSEAELDGKDFQKYQEYLKTTYPDRFNTSNLHTQIWHGHSHGNLGVFNSGTDVKQQETPGQLGYQGDYRGFFVFNAKSEVKASFLVYKPLFQRIEDFNYGLYFGEPQYISQLTRDRKKQIDDVCDALISKRTFTTSYTFGTQGHVGHHNSYAPSNRGYYAGQLYDDAYGHSYDMWADSLSTGVQSTPSTPAAAASKPTPASAGGSDKTFNLPRKGLSLEALHKRIVEDESDRLRCKARAKKVLEKVSQFLHTYLGLEEVDALPTQKPVWFDNTGGMVETLRHFADGDYALVNNLRRAYAIMNEEIDSVHTYSVFMGYADILESLVYLTNLISEVDLATADKLEDVVLNGGLGHPAKETYPLAQDMYEILNLNPSAPMDSVVDAIDALAMLSGIDEEHVAQSPLFCALSEDIFDDTGEETGAEAGEILP